MGSGHPFSGGRPVPSGPRPRVIPLPPAAASAYSSASNGWTHPQYALAKLVSWHEGFPEKAPRGEKSLKQSAFAAGCEKVNSPERAQLGQVAHARRVSWLAPLEARGLARRTEVETLTPVVVHLVSLGPLELGLALHHVYGFPILPGSGLKGLAHAQAQATDRYGTQQAVARVAILDGLPLPGFCVAADVMTPHYGKWYGGEEMSPHDGMNPVPLTFLSVPAGVRFEIALVARYPETAKADLDAVQADLLTAFEDRGFGAKTAAGYGVFRAVRPGQATPVAAAGALGSIEVPPTASRLAEPAWLAPAPALSEFHRKMREIAAIPQDRVAGEISRYIDWSLGLLDTEERRASAKAIVRRVSAKYARDRASGKPKWRQILDLSREGEP